MSMESMEALREAVPVLGSDDGGVCIMSEW